MTERSVAYDLAEHIFETIQLENDVLTPADIPTGIGSIRASSGHMTDTRQVVAFGDRADTSQPSREVLTKAKNGAYYFQVTEGVYYTGNPSKLGRMVITPNSPEAHTMQLIDSLLIKDLSRIAVKATFPEKF
ncbi:MAG: hypothetical protein QG649_77 [Patescibacteria group bacterium]|jgi:hypothetical protein|nr:hypothetical protein [Candidatus Saccharibacteria bacterium]MDQ5886524.1 hypothetical protein [Patescibacteria group bacterium]MDQ5931992.1 hypothetical protein [Patescibacteria group bacterium]